MEEKIEQIFRTVMDWEDDVVVDDSMTPNTVEEWDSLVTMTFTIELGKEFDIKFDYDEIVAMNSIRDIKRIIERKLTR